MPLVVTHFFGRDPIVPHFVRPAALTDSDVALSPLAATVAEAPGTPAAKTFNATAAPTVIAR
jgi:hypothetical protein